MIFAVSRVLHIIEMQFIYIIGRTIFLSDRETNEETSKLININQYKYDPNLF